MTMEGLSISRKQVSYLLCNLQRRAVVGFPRRYRNHEEERQAKRGDLKLFFHFSRGSRWLCPIFVEIYQGVLGFGSIRVMYLRTVFTVALIKQSAFNQDSLYYIPHPERPPRAPRPPRPRRNHSRLRPTLCVWLWSMRRLSCCNHASHISLFIYYW